MVRPEASYFGCRRQSGVPLALERIPDIGGEDAQGAVSLAPDPKQKLAALPYVPCHAETLEVSLRGNVDTRMPEHH
jgi:hypothetical protein